MEKEIGWGSLKKKYLLYDVILVVMYALLDHFQYVKCFLTAKQVVVILLFNGLTIVLQMNNNLS